MNIMEVKREVVGIREIKLILVISNCKIIVLHVHILNDISR